MHRQYCVLKDWQDRSVCKICGQVIFPNQRQNIEHWVPISRAEYSITQAAENKWLAHTVCNQVKGNLTPEEWKAQRNDRIIHALENWKIKEKDKKILRGALKVR